MAQAPWGSRRLRKRSAKVIIAEDEKLEEILELLRQEKKTGVKR